MSRYRRVLNSLIEKGELYIFSHQLAFLVDSTPAQVRRDLMSIGYSGNSRKGYEVKLLKNEIDALLDEPEGQKIAIVGMGNLGRAILTYLTGRNSKLTVSAAFDSDSTKVNRVICGCRCYHTDQMEDVIRREGITVGIVTVPASAAQTTIDKLVKAGIKAIVNWAPIHVHVPEGIFVETRDIMLSLEKAAFFAKKYK